ncbi:MAG: hypothetical protein M5U22_21090 [Thermoleophilia bacterium]|nr:hypothetical protein [Thermoleophilia bacterium]
MSAARTTRPDPANMGPVAIVREDPTVVEGHTVACCVETCGAPED